MEIVEEAIKTYKESPMEKKNFDNFAKVLARKARILELKDDLEGAIAQYE